MYISQTFGTFYVQFLHFKLITHCKSASFADFTITGFSILTICFKMSLLTLARVVFSERAGILRISSNFTLSDTSSPSSFMIRVSDLRLSSTSFPWLLSARDFPLPKNGVVVASFPLPNELSVSVKEKSNLHFSFILNLFL